jgi:hypothetical protein
MRVVLLAILFFSATFAGCFEDTPLVENHDIPGSLALACLRNDVSSLVIEIDYSADNAPTSESISTLKSRLASVCDKPGGITVSSTATVFPHSGSWTADDVRASGHETRETGPLTESGVLRWHIIFPAGKYTDESVLGVAVDASTIAIFQDSVDEAEGFLGRPSRDDVEKAVMVHEFGHLLGLVNLVYDSPFSHEDSEHLGHSDNEDSVMYWAVETIGINQFITGDIPDDFDVDDKADLAGLADGSISARKQIHAS